MVHQAIYDIKFEFIHDEALEFAMPVTKEFKKSYTSWKQHVNRDLGVGKVCLDVAKWMEQARPKRSDGRIASIVARIMCEMDAGLSLKERINKIKAKMRGSGSQDDEDSACLQIATFHSSKGLEWPNVWMFRCNDGVIPSDKSPEDEARRLFYVGMTRAEMNLSISYHTRPSMFVKEAFPEVSFAADEYPEDEDEIDDSDLYD